MNSRSVALKAVEIAEEKKAQKLVVLNLKKISPIADYFIIFHGNSSVHMKIIAQELEKKLSEVGVALLNSRKFDNDRWILLDFGFIVIHIFSEEAREYYQLERLWIDAKRELLSGSVSTN